MRRDEFDQRLTDEARFPRTRYAGDGRKRAQWKRRVEIAQVVTRYPREPQPRFRRARLANGKRAVGKQVAPRDRGIDLRQTRRWSAVEHAAPGFTRSGSDIDDPVGVAHDVEIVLDDEERIAGLFEPIERAQERLGVGRMQSRGRFVEHVDDAEEIRAHLRRQTKTLQFARR